MASRVRIPLERRLTARAVPRSGPYKWPVPLLARLRQLVEQANDSGAETKQAELLAALLLAAPTEGPRLQAAVQKLRVSKVRQALVEDPGGQQAFFAVPGPGRPARP